VTDRAPVPSAAARPLRVLLVENNPADVELCLRELKRDGFDVTADVVETMEDFRQRLASQPYDVILADYSLPGWNGMEALRELRARSADLPFILVTGALGEEAAVACIKSGASDCVLKDRLPRLPLAVQRAIQERSIRHQQEAAALAQRSSEARYRLLFERNLAGVYRAALDGRMLDLNEACARIFGYASREDALRHTLWDIAPSRAEMEMLIALVQKQKTFTDLEVQLKRIDGRPVWILGSANLVEGEPGEPPAIEGTIIDITDRKRLEEQLRQSAKMEAVGRLAGGVAHDFNNLLTAILGYSDILLERLPARSPLRRHALEVKRAGERAADLTRQLLAFSRQQVLEPRVLDLNAVVTDMQKLLRRLIGEHIELTSHLEPGLGKVKADPSQIEQVILNLVVNARDAMPEGGKLTLSTRSVRLDERYASENLNVKPGSYVLLSVSDTGCGMDAETRARIFEPFFTTKGKEKGTGLGLATVYGVVRQSGGHIEVESELGKGSTFNVYLPQVEAEAPERPQQRRKKPGGRHGSETVLLVEDEEAVRVLARRVLKAQGYHVLEARRTGDAIRLAETYPGPIPLMVTDIVMPQMSGPDLARRLAASRPEMKVLFMSGYPGGSVDQLQGLDAAATFIQKPFTSATLSRKVRELLDSSSSSGRHIKP
jgi:two-component system cell cycle sensor histidine kinase/response regulator CckA